jgi:hypothetical protein
MPFSDIPPKNPYLRLFTQGPNTRSIIFSSHGIWRPAKEGMTTLKYTYYWYAQPTASLSYQEYRAKVQQMGTAPPVDTFGPGSGQVANMLLLPLEQSLFGPTVQGFNEKVGPSNPQGLALLAFHGNKDVTAMTLSMLDTQLLPALRYPVTTPVHMVVCRSLAMKNVTPVVKNNVAVIWPLTPFNSITDDML